MAPVGEHLPKKATAHESMRNGAGSRTIRNVGQGMRIFEDAYTPYRIFEAPKTSKKCVHALR